MGFTFQPEDFKAVESVLGSGFHADEGCSRMILENQAEKRKISLEIFPDIPIGKKRGNLISVYTESSHLQLHFCSGYVVSEMLGEVTFIAQCGSKVSGLIIEKGAGCSLFANVDAGILSGDFTNLGPEVMLSGIALSLAETVLPKDLKTRKK